jgi:AcrR family transcriptional regulator
MTKGNDTRNSILEAGLGMASQFGLEDVTIGSLAKTMGMSKSGIFGHFQSKENLQLQIIGFAVRQFGESVLLPALKIRSGIARINAMVENWIKWGDSLSGGCIFVSASNEFTDRPGPVRQALLDYQRTWLASLEKLAQSAVNAGEFRPDTDTGQFAFELYSLMLGFHYYHRMLQDTGIRIKEQKALERLIKNYQ